MDGFKDMPKWLLFLLIGVGLVFANITMLFIAATTILEKKGSSKEMQTEYTLLGLSIVSILITVSVGGIFDLIVLNLIGYGVESLIVSVSKRFDEDDVE